MNVKTKVTLQIAINTLVSLLLIAFILFKTTNKMHWNGMIVALSIFVNIIIVYRARDARKFAER